MPITYQLDPESKFIDTRCIGDVTLAEALSHFPEIEADTRLPSRLDPFAPRA